ncbi:unnamed protein product, partial [Vitrella brassicaformis CCMP3155]
RRAVVCAKIRGEWKIPTVTERKYSTSAVRFKQSNSNIGARLRHGRRRHTSRNSH